VSAGDDMSVRLWQLPGSDGGASVAQHGQFAPRVAPVASYLGKNAFRDVDHHWKRAQFATAGATVELWDHERSAPVASYTWGVDTVTSVRFNPSEPDIFASCGSDRRRGGALGFASSRVLFVVRGADAAAAAAASRCMTCARTRRCGSWSC
jgi:WD repeat and SOF domain-containing protein 1